MNTVIKEHVAIRRKEKLLKTLRKQRHLDDKQGGKINQHERCK